MSRARHPEITKATEGTNKNSRLPARAAGSQSSVTPRASSRQHTTARSPSSRLRKNREGRLFVRRGVRWTSPPPRLRQASPRRASTYAWQLSGLTVSRRARRGGVARGASEAPPPSGSSQWRLRQLLAGRVGGARGSRSLLPRPPVYTPSHATRHPSARGGLPRGGLIVRACRRVPRRFREREGERRALVCHRAASAVALRERHLFTQSSIPHVGCASTSVSIQCERMPLASVYTRLRLGDISASLAPSSAAAQQRPPMAPRDRKSVV